MTFRIAHGETVGDAFRRIGVKQADKALDDVVSAGRSTDNEEAIHDCRKGCKKLRGLIRLVRPALDAVTYHDANAAFRDAAHELSVMRDAHALLTTFDASVARSDGRRTDGTDAVRTELARRADEETGDADAFQRAADLLRTGRDLIVHADLDADGWDAVGGGLAKTYGRGRTALSVAHDDPAPDHFHELRKRAKYSWFHVRLVTSSAPVILGPLGRQLKQLADGLGDAHDLAVLGAQLEADPGAFGGETAVNGVLDVLGRRRGELEGAGLGLALQLYAEPPKRFTRRVERYWSVWRDE